jgi:predicted metal-dependent hydrolase
VVKAPLQSDIALVERKIRKRGRWIVKQQNFFRQFTPRTPDRRYVSGETHLYLGRQYRLKVSQGMKHSVKLSRGCFWVQCKSEASQENIKSSLNKWFLEKAKEKLTESLDRCWPKFSKYGFDKPKLSIRRMSKRWGSLSPSGTITLNSELVKAPKECIDYVVIHELCHLKYQNHGSGFFKLLESVSPNWEKVKHKLELILA